LYRKCLKDPQDQGLCSFPPGHAKGEDCFLGFMGAANIHKLSWENPLNYNITIK